TREDYLEKLDAGAALVELYTGFVYEGYRIVSRILRESGVRA
ncbi:MAG: dihydroorotate dehydrogenase (quinone), partial [Planctomycetota bacterium]|nr:dihydroorotate dehydrogenase (quinone) [Planctomycetota bacterium]